MRRVAVYVDGFNLYHGLRDRGWSPRGFLDERLNTAYPTTYIVTKKGRAYAVENDLV